MPELATPAKYNLPNSRQNLPDSPFLHFGAIPQMPEDTRALTTAQINATAREKEAAMQAQTIATISGVLAKLPEAIQKQHREGVEWGYKRKNLEDRAAVETKKLAILNDPELQKEFDINYDANGGISMKKRDPLDDAYRKSQIFKNLRSPSTPGRVGSEPGSLENEFEGTQPSTPSSGGIGRTTIYGYKGDTTPDDASLGLGKFADKGPTGAFDNNLREGSMAFSPDIAAQLKAKGVKPMEQVVVTLEDGTKVNGFYDDHTSQSLSGRVDLYSPSGDNPLKDKKVISVDPANAEFSSRAQTRAKEVGGYLSSLNGKEGTSLRADTEGSDITTIPESSEITSPATSDSSFPEDGKPIRRPLGNVGRIAPGVYVSPLGGGKTVVETNGKKSIVQTGTPASAIASAEIKNAKEDEKKTMAASIADAIMSGKQAPDMKALYGMGPYIREALASKGYDLAEAQQDWTAVNKHFATLNGPAQLRLRQAVDFTFHSLDLIENLAKEWKAGGFPVLNRARMFSAKQGLLGPEAQSLAQRLDAQINDMTSEMGTVYKGGNSSTDHTLKLAAENLKSDFSEKTMLDSIAVLKQTLAIRQNSIKNVQAILPSGKSDMDGIGELNAQDAEAKKAAAPVVAPGSSQAAPHNPEAPMNPSAAMQAAKTAPGWYIIKNSQGVTKAVKL